MAGAAETALFHGHHAAPSAVRSPDVRGTEPAAPAEHAEPVVVAGFGDIGEAEVAQAKLRAYGIESVLVDHVEGGAHHGW